MKSEKKKIYLGAFKTKDGYWGVSCSDKGLTGISFPHKEKKEVLKKLLDRKVLSGYICVENSKKAKVYFDQVLLYLKGKLKKFDIKVDFLDAGDFQKNVWKTAGKIAFGETRSYSWIAGKINKPAACRAVGNAIGKNPVPLVVPCHRILRKDGALGGFSGGLDWKRRLLNLENIKGS